MGNERMSVEGHESETWRLICYFSKNNVKRSGVY